jgi:hypothetical protein
MSARRRRIRRNAFANRQRTAKAKRLDVGDFIIIIIIGGVGDKRFGFGVGGILAGSCPLFIFSSCPLISLSNDA